LTYSKGVTIFIVAFGVALITQSLAVQNTPLFAHRDGCHRWHSCPSDNGSYVCGDLGHDDGCSKSSKSKKSDNDKVKTKSKKSSKSNDEAEYGESKDIPKEKSEDKSENIDSMTVRNTMVVTPAPTKSEGIEMSGPVTYVVDGDTLDLSGSVRIRLALVNIPEVGERGFDEAKKFVEDLCLYKNGEVDIDDGQRQGSFGRDIGVVYCERTNLNEALINNSLATISTEFCDVSEFADEMWAASYCSDSSVINTDTPTVMKTTTIESPITVTKEVTSSNEMNETNCSSSYPDFCIPSPPPDLDCRDISKTRFTVSGPDPHSFDRDGDGIGCES
jgi:micrococcal nuclease